MRRPDSVSNVSGTCSAYFTISFEGNYARRVSDLPSGSFPGACREAPAAELLSWDSCNHITHPVLNAIFPAGKLIVLPDQQGLQATGGGAQHSVSQHRAQGVRQACIGGPPPRAQTASHTRASSHPSPVSPGAHASVTGRTRVLVPPPRGPGPGDGVGVICRFPT